MRPEPGWGCCAQIDRCFGFETAVEEAQRALLAAKVCPQTVLQRCCVHPYPWHSYSRQLCVGQDEATRPACSVAIAPSEKLEGPSSGIRYNVGLVSSVASSGGGEQRLPGGGAGEADGQVLGLHCHAGLHGFRQALSIALLLPQRASPGACLPDTCEHATLARANAAAM